MSQVTPHYPGVDPAVAFELHRMQETLEHIQSQQQPQGSWKGTIAKTVFVAGALVAFGYAMYQAGAYNAAEHTARVCEGTMKEVFKGDLITRFSHLLPEQSFFSKGYEIFNYYIMGIEVARPTFSAMLRDYAINTLPSAGALQYMMSVVKDIKASVAFYGQAGLGVGTLWTVTSVINTASIFLGPIFSVTWKVGSYGANFVGFIVQKLAKTP